MEFLIGLFTDLPAHLAQWTQTFGPWFYVILFAIVFCETGLVVTPILPGDSLLFATGAVCAVEGGPSVGLSMLAMFLGALLGDCTNYSVGRWLGLKFFVRGDSLIFNPKHLEKTNRFYEKHGGRTIILARFMPIVRTYAPFVAGLGRMPFMRFASFSFVGALLWIPTFTILGHRFGGLPSVKQNFHYVIGAIVLISLLPIAYEFYRGRRSPTANLTGETK
jgi:membrane-associated protein